MGKDDATWLKICYGFLAIIIAFVVYKAFGTVALQFGWAEEYSQWFSMVNNFLAVLVSAAVVYWVQSKPQRREYHHSAIAELRKVNWPSVPDTKKMTMIVVVVVAVFAVILAIFDIFWSKALPMILP